MDDVGSVVAGIFALYALAIFAYWLAVMFLIAWVASQKGRSGVKWFFLALIFNVMALWALMAVPNVRRGRPTGEGWEGPTRG